MKVMFPEKFFLIRGNHEFDAICSQYGFLDEIINYHNPKKVKENIDMILSNDIYDLDIYNSDPFDFSDEEEENEQINIITPVNRCDVYYDCHKNMDCYKYSQKLYYAFIKAFSYLPIAAIVNKTNFCIHGGLSPSLKNLNQIRNNIRRPIFDFEENELLSDIVWSDPIDSYSLLFAENSRGRGYFFNQKATFDFLKKNSLSRIIRAHECVKHGSHSHFDDKCITVFSASSYSKSCNNKSGILRLFQNEERIEFITFPPLPRLQKCEAAYYKVQPLFEKRIENHLCFSFRHPVLD